MPVRSTRVSDTRFSDAGRSDVPISAIPLLSHGVLGLQVAGFAAGAAVVDSVLAQADFKQALAQPAVFVATAASFQLVADHAYEFLGHNSRDYREISNPATGQRSVTQRNRNPIF